MRFADVEMGKSSVAEDLRYGLLIATGIIVLVIICSPLLVFLALAEALSSIFGISLWEKFFGEEEEEEDVTEWFRKIKTT